MASFRTIFAFAVIAAFGIVAGPVLAQSETGLTAEQITDAFKKQKTRGLVIVPSGGESPSATATTEVAPSAAEYNAVDAADQVNVQISFDFDSAALREDQKPKLVTLCKVMKSIDVSLFQIIGHTDSSGSASYNQRLSLLRAQEVKRYMVNDCGIAETRLKALGLGESAPLDKGHPRSEVNRRVEFQALG